MKLSPSIARLLRWSERYTKTDMVYLATGGFWLTVGQGVSSLSALVLAVAFANLVPPETYGTYKYILSIAGIFALFTLPGLNTAVSRAVALGQEGVVHSATDARTQASLTGGFLLLVGSLYYFLNENAQLSVALLVVAVSLPVFDTFTTYLAYLTGKRRFKEQAQYHALTQIVSVAVLIGTMSVTSTLSALLLAYFVPLAFMRYLFYQFTSQKYIAGVYGDRFRDTLSYGKHLTVMQILGTISGQIDKILLWKFLGPVHLAVYTFAIAIPEQLKGPLKGLGELAFPKFAAQTEKDVYAHLSSFWRKFFISILVLLTISVAYIFVAPYLFAFLFPAYLASVPYSQVFALSLVTGASILPITLLEAQKKIKAQYVFTTIQPIMHIVLMATLIPAFGIIGAIWAFVIGRFLTLALVVVLVARMFGR